MGLRVKVDLNRIAVFVKLAEIGSFTKTAQLFKQPTSRVSRTISALEAELGASLIHRTTRRFQLTDAGQRLLERCRDPLENLAAALGETGGEHERVAGLIRITAPEDIGTEVLPSLCEGFFKEYPEIRFELLFTNQVVDLVQQSVDVAIRMGSLPDSTLRMRRVGTIRSGLYASAKFLSKHGQPSIDSVMDFPCLSFSPNIHRGVWNLERRGELRTIEVDSVAISTNIFAVRAMTLASMGISVLPEYIAAGTGLVRIMKDWQSPAVPMQIVTPHRKRSPLRIRTFVEFLAMALAKRVGAKEQST